MCTASNIKLMFTAMSVVKVMMAIYLIAIGVDVTSNVDYQRAFGTSIVACGVWVLLAGFMTPCSTCIGYMGSKLHNKFLLLWHVGCDFVIFVIQLAMGSQLVAYTASLHDNEMREVCIKNTPTDKYEDTCIEWLSSDRYAGLKLVWAAAYAEAHADAEKLAYIEGIEAEYQCCGYGPPARCDAVDDKVPGDLSTAGVPDTYSNGRVVCGDEDGWYPDSGREQTYCGHYFDPTLAFPVVGGCRYEMPGTRCKDKDVEYDTLGCASQLQVIFDSNMQVKGFSVMMGSGLEFLAIVMACCFCWKRKSHDILPAYLEQVPYDPYAVDKTETKVSSLQLAEGQKKEETKSGH